jgi:hypothetical protein
MHGRSPVAVFSLIAALACAAALPAVASAQAGEVTADTAQAFAAFPVYTVTRPAGLTAHYETEVLEDEVPCAADVVRTVRVELRRGKLLTNGRRWITMRQADRRCAVPGSVGKRVRTVRIFGRRVVVRRWCFGYMVNSCKGQPVSHRVHAITFSLRHGSQRTFFSLDASMSIRAMLRAVRSLRRVDLTRPVVELREFMSPDQKIFCQIENATKPPFTWCVMGNPFRSGAVDADGAVSVCNQDPNGCIPGGGSGVPALSAGQTSRLGVFSCTAEAVAITCTVAKGAHKGTGFRIAADGATVVSPPG